MVNFPIMVSTLENVKHLIEIPLGLSHLSSVLVVTDAETIKKYYKNLQAKQIPEDDLDTKKEGNWRLQLEVLDELAESIGSEVRLSNLMTLELRMKILSGPRDYPFILVTSLNKNLSNCTLIERDLISIAQGIFLTPSNRDPLLNVRAITRELKLADQIMFNSGGSSKFEELPSPQQLEEGLQSLKGNLASYGRFTPWLEGNDLPHHNKILSTEVAKQFVSTAVNSQQEKVIVIGEPRLLEMYYAQMQSRGLFNGEEILADYPTQLSILNEVAELFEEDVQVKCLLKASFKAPSPSRFRKISPDSKVTILAIANSNNLQDYEKEVIVFASYLRCLAKCATLVSASLDEIAISLQLSLEATVFRTVFDYSRFPFWRKRVYSEYVLERSEPALSVAKTA